MLQEVLECALKSDGAWVVVTELEVCSQMDELRAASVVEDLDPEQLETFLHVEGEEAVCQGTA